MPASTEEERSRTLEIEEPSTPATPAPDVAERLKLAGNKAAAAANKLRPKTHTRLKEDDEDARVAPPPRRTLIVVICTSTDWGIESACSWVLYIKWSWCSFRNSKSEGKGLRPGLHISNGSNPCSVLKHRFTAAIKNACIHIRINNSAFAGILHCAAEYVAARSLRTRDVVACIRLSLPWLCPWIIGVARS